MLQFAVLLHLLGFALWLGGALASMVVGITSRSEPPESFATVARLQSAITSRLVAPGAALVLLTGLVLTAKVYPGAAMAQASLWVFVMQATGAIGALVVLFVALPTAKKLARLDPVGETAPLFHLLRKRQSLVGSIAGVLALVALVAAVLA
ncbi:MAG: hypothetical protein V3T16_10460 [Gemmatimonadales bacterium]